jgi:hypothetical protein
VEKGFTEVEVKNATTGVTPQRVLLVSATPHPSKSFSISFFVTSPKPSQVVPTKNKSAYH